MGPYENRISMRLRAVSLNWCFEVQLKQPKSIRGAVTSAFCDVVSIADSAVFRLAQATFPARGKALTDRCGVQVSDSSPDCLKLLYVNVSHHAASKCFAFRRSVRYWNYNKKYLAAYLIVKSEHEHNHRRTWQDCWLSAANQPLKSAHNLTKLQILTCNIFVTKLLQKCNT